MLSVMIRDFCSSNMIHDLRLDDDHRHGGILSARKGSNFMTDK